MVGVTFFKYLRVAMSEGKEDGKQRDSQDCRRKINPRNLVILISIIDGWLLDLMNRI